MIFYYLLPGYFHTAYQRFPFFGAGYNPAQVLAASKVVAVFLIFFLVGYSMDFRFRGGEPRVVVPKRLFGVTVFCTAATLVAGAMLGFGSLLVHIREGNLTDTLPSPDRLMLESVSRCSSFFAFMFGLFLFRAKKTVMSLALILITSSIFFILNSPLAVTRFVIGSYIISTFLVLLRFDRMQKFALVLALVGAQAGIFAYVSYLSRGDLNSEFRWSPAEDFVSSGDFDGFQSTINVVAMHDELGGKGGVNLASAMLFFVPRTLWPGKSPGTGGEAAIYEGYPMVNISSPLPSEFYIDFGILGVFVLSLFFGLFIRLCDDYFLHFKKTLDLTGQVLVASIAGYLFIILRGSLVGTLGPCALSLTIAAICHWYVTNPVSVASCDERALVPNLGDHHR